MIIEENLDYSKQNIGCEYNIEKYDKLISWSPQLIVQIMKGTKSWIIFIRL